MILCGLGMSSFWCWFWLFAKAMAHTKSQSCHPKACSLWWSRLWCTVAWAAAGETIGRGKFGSSANQTVLQFATDAFLEFLAFLHCHEKSMRPDPPETEFLPLCSFSALFYPKPFAMFVSAHCWGSRLSFWPLFLSFLFSVYFHPNCRGPFFDRDGHCMPSPRLPQSGRHGLPAVLLEKNGAVAARLAQVERTIAMSSSCKGILPRYWKQARSQAVCKLVMYRYV